MKTLVVLPSDPMQAYLDLGQTYEYFEDYFNPTGFFDKVYALSPWGNVEKEDHGSVTYIKKSPIDFKKFIADIKPDVIRAYGGYHCADWLAMCSVPGIPTVISIHDTNPDLIYDSIKFADNIIYMSKAVQDAVRKKIEIFDKGEWIMGNRVDPDLFSYTKDDKFFSYLNNRFGYGRHILHVGRKAKQKNLDTVIRALKYLPIEFSVIFVGKGDFSKYEELALELGVADRVFNVDHVNNTELPKWYSWCDCFCTPSRWEGFGFVFIEAACCQATIVTSDIAPMNEFLNEDNSILVEDYENPESIANAIFFALSKNQKVAEIKKKAKLVGKQFSKKKIDDLEVKIYKQIIQNGPRNRKDIGSLDFSKLESKYSNF